MGWLIRQLLDPINGEGVDYLTLSLNNGNKNRYCKLTITFIQITILINPIDRRIIPPASPIIVSIT